MHINTYIRLRKIPRSETTTYTQAHMTARTHIHTNTHKHTQNHIQIGMFSFAERYIHTCIHTHREIHTHAHIHAHTNSCQAQRTVRALTDYACDVQVWRGGKWVTIKSDALVPGQLIRVEENMRVACDAVLVARRFHPRI
jgi:spore coat polysaccharide biosynthesis protein SpsF (cytidylyltransferase family)